MTLIFECNNEKEISLASRGGHSSVAVRVPSHPLALDLLEKCDFFVSAPSANKFGRVSPTKTDHVAFEFDDVLILEGDQSECGLESTIISCLGPAPVILRAGSITEQDITGLGLEVVKDNKTIAAPGTLEKHYAPSVPVISIEVISEAANQANSSIILLENHTQAAQGFKLVSVNKSVEDFARNLYSFFRESESIAVEAIYILAPPNDGIGAAINDRVKKAENSGK